MTARIISYTLRIEGPDYIKYKTSNEFDKMNQSVVDYLGEVLSRAEELINEKLPDGFYCKIEE